MKLEITSPEGTSRVTVGLSSVGPPPRLMMTQLLASATMVGSPSRTTSPPGTSAWKHLDRSMSSDTMK